MSTTNRNNLLRDLPVELVEEFVQVLAENGQVRIERIVSMGHASPAGFWYDQDQDEWVVLLRGAARIRFEDELMEMKPGDYLNIPAHRKHRVEWTTPDEHTVWLAVHSGLGESRRTPRSPAQSR